MHTEGELARVLELPEVEKHILGINNRDLGTFKVDLANTQRIMDSEWGQQVGGVGRGVKGARGQFQCAMGRVGRLCLRAHASLTCILYPLGQVPRHHDGER